MENYHRGLGFRYLLDTKYHRDKPVKDDLGFLPPPPAEKSYFNAPRFPLPEPKLDLGHNLWECLRKRRSIRKYSNQPITVTDLSNLVWATQGVTEKIGRHLLRTAPSAGALYPFETYLYINNVEGLEKGFYHLHVASFSLEQLKTGEFSRELTAAALGQTMVGRAAVVFLWSAVPLRCMAKYRNRGIRYIFLDLGHVCQNLQLAATVMGMGSCPIGAFFDDELNNLLELDGVDETIVYMNPVGKL